MLNTPTCAVPRCVLLCQVTCELAKPRLCACPHSKLKRCSKLSWLQIASRRGDPTNPLLEAPHKFTGTATNSDFVLVNGGYQPIIRMKVGHVCVCVCDASSHMYVGG